MPCRELKVGRIGASDNSSSTCCTNLPSRIISNLEAAIDRALLRAQRFVACGAYVKILSIGPPGSNARVKISDKGLECSSLGRWQGRSEARDEVRANLITFFPLTATAAEKDCSTALLVWCKTSRWFSFSRKSRDRWSRILSII